MLACLSFFYNASLPPEIRIRFGLSASPPSSQYKVTRVWSSLVTLSIPISSRGPVPAQARLLSVIGLFPVFSSLQACLGPYAIYENQTENKTFCRVSSVLCREYESVSMSSIFPVVSVKAVLLIVK